MGKWAIISFWCLVRQMIKVQVGMAKDKETGRGFLFWFFFLPSIPLN